MGHVINVPDWDAKLEERRLKYAMALQLPDPMELQQTIKLLKADPSGETFVVVKQATTGEDAAISALWAKTAWEFDDEQRGKVKQYNDVSRAQIMAEQVRLTLLDCNITDHKGKPLFTKVDPSAQRQQGTFYPAWEQLPSAWSEEIYEAVLVANPQWRPEREAQQQLGEASAS
jgi:hypothetical protein